jgi:hypothetical protein
MVQRFSTGAEESRRLALGPGQRLYVAARDGIHVVSAEGQPLARYALPEAVRCVAVAEDGTIYAGLRSRIEVLDAEGKKKTGWDVPGARSWLTGLAVGAKDVLAADAGSRVILRYDLAGKLAGRIGERNKDRNIPGLIVPSPYLDVALGSDGLVRVNNPGRHCVETYTLEGDLESSWGKPGTSSEGFCGCCNPVSVALLPDGRCLTAEKGLPRAKAFSPDGSFQGLVAGPDSFPENGRAGALSNKSDGLLGGLDVAADAQGRIFILDIVANQLSVWRPQA